MNMKVDLKDNTQKKYLILIAGMIIQLCAGVIYMWSIFKQPVADYLLWDSGSAALTSSIMLVSFVFGMIVGGKILTKFNLRLTAVMGTIIMSAGILTASFVTSSMPDLLYVTYGVAGGFGVGIVYTCTLSVVQRWFFDRRGFATGMMVGAFGFSLVIFAPLADYLLDNIGVSETFQIFGIAFLIICLICSMFLVMPPKEYAVGNSKTSVISSQKQYIAKEMIRTRSFYLIIISMFFILSAYFILNPLFKTLGVERGLTDSIATMGVMITGACSACGRLFITWMSDKIGRHKSLLTVFTLTLVGVIAIIYAENILFIACLAIIAFAFGGASGIYATVTADHFGTVNMGTNYGIVSLGFAASALVFPLISKYLSPDGDYTMSFVVSAMSCIAALICIMLLKQQKNDQSTNYE